MHRLFYVLLLVLVTAGCTSKEQKIQRIVPEITSSGEFNGFIQIQSFGKAPFSYSHLPNHSGLPSVDQSTAIYLASLTKLFTEIIVLKLAEEGKIDLDRTISDHRNSFIPSFGNKISVNQLLEMKSGLPRELDSENLSGVSFDEDGKAGTFLDGIPDLELAFDPGTKNSYSNLNYWLLGAVIEEVTGLNIEEAFKEYIGDPVGMNSTGLIINDKIIVNGFYKEGNSWKRDGNDYFDRYTSGGFYSTVDDLSRLINALDQGKLLSENSLNLLLGENNRLEVFGSLKGYSNMLIWDQEHQFSVIALNNVGLPDLTKMTELQQKIYQVFEIKSAPALGRRIQVLPMDSLSAEVKLEHVLATWSEAVLIEDKREIYNILKEAGLPGSFEEDDPTWDEIIKAKRSMENFRVAGYRWVENEIPAGIEVWFVSDSEAKIGFLFIPASNNPEVLEGMMVKPVDTKWMGKQF